MKINPRILAAVIATLSIAGCGRVQAPEPVSAAPTVSSTEATPIPTLDQQRTDKRGD